MRKLVLLALFIVSMCIAGTAFASLPNTNYDEAGKGAVGISITHSSLDAYLAETYDFDFNKKWNLGANAEIVIDPKWALGFNYMRSKGSNDISTLSMDANAKLKTYEFTLQYMAYQNKRFSLIPYAGWVRDEGKMATEYYGSGSAINSELVFGTKLVYDFNKRVVSYVDLGFGDNVFKWGIGVAYKFTPKMALSVDYDHREVKGMTNQRVPGQIDAKVKRLAFGLTYLF